MISVNDVTGKRHGGQNIALYVSNMRSLHRALRLVHHAIFAATTACRRMSVRAGTVPPKREAADICRIKKQGYYRAHTSHGFALAANAPRGRSDADPAVRDGRSGPQPGQRVTMRYSAAAKPGAIPP